MRMKTLRDIVTKVGVVLFILTLLSNYFNIIPTIEPFSQMSYSSFVTKFTYFICCLLLFRYTYKHKFKQLNLSNIACIIIIYSLYRFNIISHSQWIFVELCGVAYYLDVIFLLPISLLPNRLIDNSIKNLSEKSNNNPSEAINDDDDDKFGYYQDAKQLTGVILKQNKLYNSSSLIIGLRGEWGEGKTSYLNMLALSVKNHNREEIDVVRFNPWFCNSYEQMVSDFFVELGATVGNDIGNRDLHKYAKAVIDADLGIWSKLINFFYKVNESSLTELHTKLNDQIKTRDKLILILIDDLDRLSETEILDTFKLIRNNANFANTVFVVSYDYDYLKHTLKGINDFDRYIEKIFPCPYTLPKPKDGSVISVIKDRMQGILDLKEDNKKYIDDFLKVIDRNISLRNAVRLAFQTFSNISNLKDKDEDIIVNLSDYLAINYISIIAPEVYKNIANTSPEFSDNDLLINERGYIKINFNKGLLSSLTKEYLTEVEYVNKILINEENREKANEVYSILKTLFNRSCDGCPQINDKLYNINRISDARTFQMFFTRATSEDFITKHEFETAWNAGEEKFASEISKWVGEKSNGSLSYRIAEMNLSNKDDLTKALRAILPIYPESKLETYRMVINPSRLSNVVIPCENSLTERINNDVYNTYIKTLWDYIENIQDDNETVIYKKYLMLCSNFVAETLQHILYINSSISEGINGYKDYTPIPDINLEKLKIENIRIRLSKTTSYNNFTEEYWYNCEDFHEQTRLDVRTVFKNHISENISSFIENYPPKCLNASYINYLFYEYTLEESGSIYINENNWYSFFIAFMEEQPNKNEALEYYIEQVKQIG